MGEHERGLMSSNRPLPSVPNLDFERKAAKRLLRQLRAGHPESLERARTHHPAGVDSPPDLIQLSDAQLIIAREYGFASWPRLVRYYGDVERQRHTHRTAKEAHSYESSVRGILAQHRARESWASGYLARFVPRFYEMPTDEVFASEIIEDDARLAVARSNGFPSWSVLVERTDAERRGRPGHWDITPWHYALSAIRARDLEELQRVVSAHPELLTPSDQQLGQGTTLVGSLVANERHQGTENLAHIRNWLLGRGVDVQRELNRQLCGHMRIKTEKVRWLLAHDADPNWVADNGIPVMEHALIAYWNGEAADLVAERATPRDGLWISSGLGDVDGVARFLDERGKPTWAARNLRPPFDAVGIPGIPSHPDPSDEELLTETFFVAMLNGRSNVIEYMVSRGFPVNGLMWGQPPAQFAIGNRFVSVLESLLRCGADLDAKVSEKQTLREWAGEWFGSVHQAGRDSFRPIVGLCGLDADAILADLDKRPREPPGVHPEVKDALELAGDDAHRLGQSEISPENQLYGLLRGAGHALMFIRMMIDTEFERFRTDINSRVFPRDDVSDDRPKLFLDREAQEVVRAANEHAEKHRNSRVTGPHLLRALALVEDGPVHKLLEPYGVEMSGLLKKLDQSI